MVCHLQKIAISMDIVGMDGHIVLATGILDFGKQVGHIVKNRRAQLIGHHTGHSQSLNDRTLKQLAHISSTKLTEKLGGFGAVTRTDPFGSHPCFCSAEAL